MQEYNKGWLAGFALCFSICLSSFSVYYSIDNAQRSAELTEALYRQHQEPEAARWVVVVGCDAEYDNGDGTKGAFRVRNGPGENNYSWIKYQIVPDDGYAHIVDSHGITIGEDDPMSHIGECRRVEMRTPE